MAQSLSQIPIILENYQFNFPKIPNRLKCVICELILKNAKQTSCGCKCCEKCIKNYLSNGPKPCPSKQIECANVILDINKDINQDNATNREIGNIEVNCPFINCNYKNLLKNMVEHINNCEFREISCDKCGQKLLANIKLKHDQNNCEMRIISCIYCDTAMQYKDLDSIHLNPDCNELCVKYVSLCPNNCSVKDKVNLKEHLKNCVNKKIECPFHDLDCNSGKMTKEKLTFHFKTEFQQHMTSLIKIIKDMEVKVNLLQSELESQKQITKELFEMNQKSSESRIKLEKVVEEYKKKVPTTTTIQTSEKSIIFRNASFIWKFTEFEIRRLDAESGGRVSITSDPFYTSEFGYKMCLRIYPAGDGVGKGTHLSVFFAIMKGDFDDLLSWPFKQKVTLSILDQESGTKHHSDTFKPDARSACYQKPTDECNIASGSPKFILLSLIMNNSIYCKNDTIFLKINVDTIGISKP